MQSFLFLSKLPRVRFCSQFGSLMCCLAFAIAFTITERLEKGRKIETQASKILDRTFVLRLLK